MTKQDEQKIYKELSEAATRFFDVLFENNITNWGDESLFLELQAEISNAKYKMGDEWTNYAIKQSFNLVAKCYK